VIEKLDVTANGLHLTCPCGQVIEVLLDWHEPGKKLPTGEFAVTCISCLTSHWFTIRGAT
jgi:hypothetical protein